MRDFELDGFIGFFEMLFDSWFWIGAGVVFVIWWVIKTFNGAASRRRIREQFRDHP